MSTIVKVAAGRTRGTGLIWRSTLPAEEAIRGGEARERCAFDLRLPEGVPAEEQRRTVGDGQARFGVAVSDPAVGPPDEGGLEGKGPEVGAEPVRREGEQGAGDLRLVVVEVVPAPSRSRVDGDGVCLRDAFAAVVPDPVKRLAFDLHSARLGHAGGAVE